MENLVELFGVEEIYIRRWIKDGSLPVAEKKPLRFDVKEIDKWIAEGNLERFQPCSVRATKLKGVWTS